jgi:hypothetical protein
MKQILLMIAVVMGQSVLGAMQDQDEIIARAMSRETDKDENGKLLRLHLAFKKDTKGSGLITDAGLRKVGDHKELEQLKQLFLSGTKITDAGLFHVARLKDLERLTLVGCDKITDVGLRHFPNRRNFKEIRITGTAVSKDGVREFKKRFPKCEIRHNPTK